MIELSIVLVTVTAVTTFDTVSFNTEVLGIDRITREPLFAPAPEIVMVCPATNPAAAQSNDGDAVIVSPLPFCANVTLPVKVARSWTWSASTRNTL